MNSPLSHTREKEISRLARLYWELYFVSFLEDKCGHHARVTVNWQMMQSSDAVACFRCISAEEIDGRDFKPSGLIV